MKPPLSVPGIIPLPLAHSANARRTHAVDSQRANTYIALDSCTPTDQHELRAAGAAARESALHPHQHLPIPLRERRRGASLCFMLGATMKSLIRRRRTALVARA